MRKKLKLIFFVIVLLILAYGVYYVNDYSHAESVVNNYLNGTDNVSVSKLSNGLFVDGYGNDTVLIFYPGAKVEYTSYLPMFVELANQGVDCYLVEMPFNIAFLGQNSADSIINTTNYSTYVIAGHSLGGVVASSYMNQSGRCDGLILFAAYPTEKIDKPVLSIYGSEDNVLDKNRYNDSKPLMSNITEYVIDGGNHAQFGYYGNQSGDGMANISAENQQNQTVYEILEFVNLIRN
ncbi:alpha/beta hydrolase [bacterium]|nr:alpha/beta hydrolase [bacterium]